MSLISQTAEYALRAIVYLALAEGSPRTARRIAQDTHVKQEYLSKVMQQLRRSGLVSARPGAGGGFQLAREPEEMTVFEVVTAIDPIPRITECPLGLASHEAKLCLLHARLDSAINAVETAFRETTIAELVPDRSQPAGRCSFPARSETDLSS